MGGIGLPFCPYVVHVSQFAGLAAALVACAAVQAPAALVEEQTVAGAHAARQAAQFLAGAGLGLVWPIQPDQITPANPFLKSVSVVSESKTLVGWGLALRED